MALTAKQEAFAVALAKGSNASDAYRAVYSAGRMTAKSINEEACHLVANPKVASRVAELREPAMKAARLEIEDTLRQLACVLRSDARRLFRPDGSLIPVHELDDATAAAISSIELDEEGRPKKIRLWSKIDAIEKAMRHLGLFERDNGQKAPNLALQINLVQAPPARINGPAPVNVNLLEGKTLTQEDAVAPRAGTRDPSPSHKGTIDGNQERATGDGFRARAGSEVHPRQVPGLFRR
jgi:phage terminase small subunit